MQIDGSLRIDKYSNIQNNSGINEQISLAKNMEVWNDIERLIMTAKTSKALIQAIVRTKNELKEDDELRRSIGKDALIALMKRKKEALEQEWTVEIGSVYRSMCKCMKYV